MSARLISVNRALSKYNLLLGVEDVGLMDCNKYYVSFLTPTVIIVMLTLHSDAHSHCHVMTSAAIA